MLSTFARRAQIQGRRIGWGKHELGNGEPRTENRELGRQGLLPSIATVLSSRFSVTRLRLGRAVIFESFVDDFVVVAARPRWVPRGSLAGVDWREVSAEG